MQFKKAPDGAPVVPLSRSTGFRHLAVETMRVKGPLRAMTINVSDFNAKIHTRIEDDAETPDVRSDPPLRSAWGKQTRDELAVMTMSVLRELPEFEHMEGDPSKKDDVISAILSVRERLPEGPSAE